RLSIAKQVGCTLTLPSSARENHIRGLLADHVHRADDEESWNARKDRRIHDSQMASVMDAEIVSDHAPAISWPDRTGSTRMMSPGLPANVLAELGVRFAVG